MLLTDDGHGENASVRRPHTDRDWRVPGQLVDQVGILQDVSVLAIDVCVFSFLSDIEAFSLIWGDFEMA